MVWDQVVTVKRACRVVSFDSKVDRVDKSSATEAGGSKVTQRLIKKRFHLLLQGHCAMQIDGRK